MALSAAAGDRDPLSAGTAGEAARDADQSRGGDGGEPARSPSCYSHSYIIDDDTTNLSAALPSVEFYRLPLAHLPFS